MLFSTNNMRNFHQRIVDYYSIIISRNAVRFYDNKISDSVRVKNDIAANHVADKYLLISRHTKTYGWFASFSFVLFYLFRSKITAFAHITRHLPFGRQSLTFCFQLFICAVTIVGLTFSQQLISIFFIQFKTLCLTIRTVFPTYINTFVPIQA